MKIGLTYTGDAVKHQNYVNWLRGHDNIEIIKLSSEDNDANELKECDALVLSGGVDIDPAITKSNSSYPNMPEVFQPERDAFEISLYIAALRNYMPILAICRGMQLVNVLEGGTLLQDLGTLNWQHKKEGITDKTHKVTIEKNTLLSEIVDIAEGNINSAHHQAIEIPGESLQVNCRAEDGTIEGLEWKDKNDRPFMLCVQWHPERMFQFPGSVLSVRIRNRFIDEIKSSITRKNENN